VSAVLRMENGVVATLTLSTVALHGPGHWAQLSGSEGTLLLTGETTLEIGRPGGAMENVSAPDDLWGQVTPNNMWARSFVRLMRDLVRMALGVGAEDRPATFRDGWEVQKVMDAIRRGGSAVPERRGVG
jgi:predicted dehydrogenase